MKTFIHTYVGDGHRLNDSREQINHDDETHRETAETTELLQEDEFTEIVHRRVDPTPTLGQQDLPVVGSNGVRMGITDELGLEVREVLQQQRRHETILSEVQQVLHVQSVDTVLRVVTNDCIGNEQRCC